MRKKATISAKGARLLTKPLWRRGLLSGVAATVEHLPIISRLTPDTIIDIGANKGQFSLFATQVWPAARIYAFEPLPGPAAKYRKILSGMPHVQLFEVAVAPTKGIEYINMLEREDSSSLLRPHPNILQVFPEARDAGHSLRIRTGPLINFLSADDLNGSVLIKLDVQGYELPCLQACDPLLALAEHLYIECSYVELYHGQALIEDVIKFLDSQSFELLKEFNTII